MTIAQLDSAIKDIQQRHHIYGLECIFMAAARNYKNELYVDKDYMLDLLSQCINRVSKEDE